MTILIHRKEDTSFEEFREYYEQEHAPLAEGMPNLRKYVVDFPTDPSEAPYDAVAHMYYDDVAALGESFESETGQEVQADAANFIDQERQQTTIVEETVRLDET
jgi:uncharacterized protein (TIGR02118 family)